MSRALSALALIAVVSSSGCATLLAPTTATVRVTSNVDGAQVIVDGQPSGTTPAVLQLSHSRPHTIIVRVSGDRDVTCVLDSSVGAVWVVLDIFTGLIGLVVDAVTESWKRLDSTICVASFGPGAVAPRPTGPASSAPEVIPENEGALGGPCYPNATCNQGLVCDRDRGRCLAPP